MEKLINSEDSQTYRFQCDCMSPEDVIDVHVEMFRIDDKYFTIDMNYYPESFWKRIKEAIKLIKGGGWNWRGFIVRPEDRKNLSEIFNPDKKFSELP